MVCDDVTLALGRLARHVADRLVAGGTTVIALTGSQGKTSTKDLLAHVLSAAGPTAATAANNNNELGVPMTVLRATTDTRYLVVEMGARGIGHIAYLCELSPPTIAAVLNVGTAHVGEFGGVEAIARAKGEIVEALGPDGRAVLNADDPRVIAMRERSAAPVSTFGEHIDVDPPEVSWRGVELDELGRASFTLVHHGEAAPVRLLVSGAHQVANAAAAAALALAAGAGLDLVAAGLCTARSGSRWRMEIDRRPDGLLVINDAYNANPASMRAALDALASIGRRRTGRTIAVLGPMLELGDEHDAAHAEVGAHAASLGVSVVVVVGHDAAGIADAARSSVPEVVVAAGRDDALSWVGKNADPDDVVLVKASRGAALELVAEQLLRQPDEEGGPTAP